MSSEHQYIVRTCCARLAQSLLGLPNHSMNIRIRGSIFDIRYSIFDPIEYLQVRSIEYVRRFDIRSSNRFDIDWFDRSNISIFDEANLFDGSIFDASNIRKVR